MKLVPGTQLTTFQKWQVKKLFFHWWLYDRDFDVFLSAHHFWITKGGMLSNRYKEAVKNEDVPKHEEDHA